MKSIGFRNSNQLSVAKKEAGNRMPAQGALTSFPFESLNAAFKRNCSSVLYKAMFVCFSYF